MASLKDLRAKYLVASAIAVTVDIATIRVAATWFDVITDGGPDKMGKMGCTDLRLKFGPHAGMLISALAQSEKPYLRDLYTKFVSNPALDTVFRAIVQLQLNESRQEIESKLI